VKDGLAAIHSPVKRLIRQKTIGNGRADSKQVPMHQETQHGTKK
jgi:hypothetical protein